MDRYEITISWSTEDDAFVVGMPELPGCMTHGATRFEALKNAEEAIALWLETAQELGRAIPEPREWGGSLV